MTLDCIKQQKIKKKQGICIYVHKCREIILRDDINIFNESVETLPIEILDKKWRNINIMAACCSPKRNNILFKDFCRLSK